MVLSLGSNQGDRLAWLARAVAELERLPDTRVTARSPVYETEPVGVAPQFANRLFLNCVAIVETATGPEAFSSAIHAIETRLGRIRGDQPNAPRTVDIDIVAFGDLVAQDPDLTLPHPRCRARRFVLQPLADLRPDYRLPGDSKTVAERLRSLPETPRVTRHVENGT